MHPPTFIYFDLGNVLLSFDHGLACRRIAEQVGVTESQIHDLIFESGLQRRYEAGEISSRDFADLFAAQIGQAFNTADFLKVCSDIFELNVSMVPIVAHLRAAGYRLGILSNTCEAHWDFVSQGRYAILQDLFEIEILSFEVQEMKPSPAIYEAAIDAVGIEPGEIFFTDDRRENVDGARQVGIDATVFRGVQPLLEDLRLRGVTTNL